MTNYQLKSGSVTIAAESKNINDAMAEADAWCSYSQSALEIIENEKVVASRSWYGCKDGLEDQDDAIDFGDCGFYADWYLNDY